MSEKKSKNKKVLVASMILAAMIVASSSFAWFTSHDEVVNKLSAKNEYAVTVTESFNPPEQWIPGQTIAKLAGAVNTGNIDAFVKLTLSNSLVLTTYGTPEAFNGANVAKYVEVKSNDNGTNNARVSLQAGGHLVYEVDSVVDKKVNSGATFKPDTTGLYIFERDNGTVVTDTTVEYVGYYYDATSSKYYALAEITPTKDTTTQAITDFTAKLQTKKTETVTPTLTYDKNNNVIVAEYTPTGGNKQKITININLSYSHAANWTNNKVDDYNQEFYYNKILVAGGATGSLVNSVGLDKSVTNEAYIDMEYNLKITADSIQTTDFRETYYTDQAKAVNADDQSTTWKLRVKEIDDSSNVTWEKRT